MVPLLRGSLRLVLSFTVPHGLVAPDLDVNRDAVAVPEAQIVVAVRTPRERGVVFRIFLTSRVRNASREEEIGNRGLGMTSPPDPVPRLNEARPLNLSDGVLQFLPPVSGIVDAGHQAAAAVPLEPPGRRQCAKFIGNLLGLAQSPLPGVDLTPPALRATGEATCTTVVIRPGVWAATEAVAGRTAPPCLLVATRSD